jgi:hypothetical protein
VPVRRGFRVGDCLHSFHCSRRCCGRLPTLPLVVRARSGSLLISSILLVMLLIARHVLTPLSPPSRTTLVLCVRVSPVARCACSWFHTTVLSQPAGFLQCLIDVDPIALFENRRCCSFSAALGLSVGSICLELRHPNPSNLVIPRSDLQQCPPYPWAVVVSMTAVSLAVFISKQCHKF